MTDSSWSYLEQLQGVELQRLYRSPPSALAVFRRLLSNLSRHFVMSMVFSPRPTLLSDFELMTKSNQSATRERQTALDQLRRYHLVRDTVIKSGKALSLVPDFARSLRQVLAGGSNNSFGQVITPAISQQSSIEELDEFARLQWEGILGYMVGSSNLAELQEPGEELLPPSEMVISLLKRGDLINTTGTQSRGYTPMITKDGFAFVLRDVNTQVWALLFLYVDIAPQLDMDKIEVLSFIFFIASLELGLAYSTAALTSSQLTILDTLHALGLIFRQDEDTPFFYPTRLAATLTSSSAALASTSQALGSSLQAGSASAHAASTSPHTTPGSGFIIMETNYRLYAYTSSPLQIALISLFIALRSRHSNMVTGKMTKQSVQRAIQVGITAEQMISYMTTHAHPQMRRSAAQELNSKQSRYFAKAASGISAADAEALKLEVIPRTITDQISLWQMERDRISSTVGYLIHKFESHAEFNEQARHCDETGVLVWKDEKKKMFFVSRVDGLQAYVKDKKERGAG